VLKFACGCFLVYFLLCLSPHFFVRAHLQVSFGNFVRSARLREKNRMAIYHLTAKTVSRNGASSAKARSEYIDRDGRYQKDAEEVQHRESGNMPEWAEDTPARYWQSADENERANGRLFKQLEFSLPKELSAEQQKELAASFCRDIAQTKDGSLPYSLALHKGHDKENPHCHMMLSERVNDGHSRTPETWFKRAGKDPEKGGARKTTALHPKEWLQQTRELWAERANQALERAGHESRVDHRSLKDQGVDREPTTHLGPAAAAMERKGRITERGEEHRENRQGQPDASQTLQKARRTLETLSGGIDQVRAGFAAWQAREAEKKRQQEQEQERQAQERARREAERKAQEQQRKTQELAERRQRDRDRGGMSL
jgi:hypothetical protein